MSTITMQPSGKDAFAGLGSLSSLERARLLIEHGIVPIPILCRQKAPKAKGWNSDEYLENIRNNPADYFKENEENIGVALGPLSGGLIDVDLDCLQASRAANVLLPASDWIHGRRERPASHYFYRGFDGASLLSLVFKDPVYSNEVILEIRSTSKQGKASQTLIPPSVHPSGEIYQFDSPGLPTVVDPSKLSLAIARLAAAALFARYWPKEGGRQDIALGLSGGLLRCGWDRDRIRTFIEAVCRSAENEDLRELDNRLGAVGCTAEKLQAGQAVTGWPTVKECLGEDGELIVRAACKWLNVKPAKTDQPRHVQTNTPSIMISDQQLRTLSAEAKAALEEANDPPVLFRKGGQIVKVLTDENSTSSLTLVNDDRMRRRLTEVTDFHQEARGGMKAAMPPAALIKDLLIRGDLDLPIVDEITRVPVIRRDGSILATAGYDAATRMIYRPDPDLQIPTLPDQPTATDVSNAVALLQEMLCDFPFEDEASRTNAIALLVTPLVRPIIDGNVPMALINGNKQGAGKGMVTEAISTVVHGARPAMSSLPSKDEEVRKKITSLLMSGTSFIVWDNVKKIIDFESIDVYLTAPFWEDRILSTNVSVKLKPRATMVATGNNIKLATDAVRRCYLISLRTDQSRPWLKTGFKHDPLLDWVRQNRGRLLASIMNIIRSWFVAGRPVPVVKKLGSFEQWTTVVGGVLEHAGLTDFLGNLEKLYEDSDEGEHEWEYFLKTASEYVGYDQPFTATDLVNKMHLASLESSFRGNNELLESLPSNLKQSVRDEKDALKLGAILGRAFRNRKGTRYGADRWSIEKDGTAHGGANKWRIISGAQSAAA